MKDPADLRFLLTLKQSRSMLAAARTLDLTPSAVTQRLQNIEKRLDIQLIERTARKWRFTDEGELLCARGATLMAEFDAMIDELQQRRHRLVGTLKIRAPFGFGRRYIAPAVAAFQEQHPDVTIALTLSDQTLGQGDERYDVIVHIGELRNSNLVAHKIAPNHRFVCAAPALLDRLPSVKLLPEHLSQSPCIALRENNEDQTLWSFRKSKKLQSVRIQAVLTCNDGDVIREWAREGRGIILRSEWDVADDLAQGRLVRLLADWRIDDADIVALTDRRTGLPMRTRKFLEFVQGRFQESVPWRDRLSTKRMP